jgi:hypothetical protein
MSGRVIVSTLAVALAQPTFAADATPPLKVLRHLEFTMTVDESSTTETKVAGFDAGSASGRATDYNGGIDAHGTIAVDVVAATTDGGLVVDVSEDAVSRKATTVRVGILNGKLLYDPHAVVTEEERTLLAFLARDFVKPDALDAGTTWVGDAAAGESGHTTYTVKSVDADAKTVALDFVGETAMSGPDGYTASTQGSMTYDTGVSVPRVFSVWRRTHVTNPGRLTTIDMRMSATLHADSLQKPKV